MTGGKTMNVELFLSTLPFMAKGMAAVFAVILVLILCIFLLNRLFSPGK